MNTKKYIFRFFLNSLLWYLFYYITEIISPDKPNPKDFGDLNMMGFILGTIMICGIHLIPFYLILIKNTYNNKLKFFILNIFIIVIFNPLSWIALSGNSNSKFETFKNFLVATTYISPIHVIIFIICFFIKHIYFKFNR
ncbi:hypothetical protein [Gemelliphila palaticanis]|uniref:Uncharacterized protein n=1 Tax=Gemelliphila palaticanis TaxID=81950 RepID=A0ABX2T0E8_9BACL|nr:hypothetical protein [Gemella palaticanis]MBF0714969.1 hypothetical protein [Gemella palaticanis]NYS46899.1 hypothetical protein [Gemella palaticanis]